MPGVASCPGYVPASPVISLTPHKPFGGHGGRDTGRDARSGFRGDAQGCFDGSGESHWRGHSARDQSVIGLICGAAGFDFSKRPLTRRAWN